LINHRNHKYGLKLPTTIEYIKPYTIVFFFILLGCSQVEKEWAELFNGENMQGWHTYGAENTHDGWSVDDGILSFDFKKKNGTTSSNLMTDSTYTNFELSLEWKISHQGNSGIFWGVVESEQYDHPYQTGPEIQILDDNWNEYIEVRGDITRAGSLYGLIPPSKIVSNPAETWNHYFLHVNHNKNVGFLKFNGKKVLQFPVHGTKWDAMVAKSGFAEWPGFGKAKTGHICLQEYGGQVSFKNIRIRDLDQEKNE